jgi:hypothetical protein
MPSVPEGRTHLKLLLESIGDRPIAFHRIYAKIGGSIHAGIFLAQSAYWSSTKKEKDGWFWKTREQWTEETCIDRHYQLRVRSTLKGMGVLEEREDRLDHKLYFRVNFQRLYELILEHQDTAPEVVPEPENEATPSAGTTAVKDSETLTLTETTPETTSEVGRSESQSQPQPPQRTRTCFKCGEDIPEDEAIQHGKTCQGRKKKQKHRRKLSSDRPPTQTESLQSEAMPPGVRKGFSEDAAPGLSEVYGLCYGLMRRGFKMHFGKSLGSFPGGRFGDELRALIDKNGAEKLQGGFDLWMEDVNRDFIRSSSFPMAVFLKDAQGWIDDAAIGPEAVSEAPRVAVISKAAWED